MSWRGWRQRLAQAPLALRVAVASAAFSLLIGTLAAASGYWALSRQLNARLTLELHGKAELVLHILSEIDRVDEVPANGHRFGDLLIGHDELHLALTDARSGRLLAGFSRAARLSVAQLAAATGQTPVRWQDDTRRGYQSVKGSGTVKDGQPVAYVLSMDLQADEALRVGYLRATLLALPVLLLAVAFGAWAVARTGLGPLMRFTRLAASVTSNTLSQRLPRRGLPMELGDLADGFNAMLARIDEGVTRLSDFSADLAHEMRTPVATLLGRTQVALSRGRSLDELRDVLAGNVEELERLTRLIADMLFLARADHDGAVLERTAVDLAAEARRVAEFLAWEAEDRGLRIEVVGEATVQADRILVQRAMTNLLSNAIRHAAAASVVGIEVVRGGAQCTLSVTNVGAVIPGDQIHRIFDRLVRLDAARSRSDGGSGLGLPIVRSIMNLHGGSVKVRSEGQSTTFSLRFPATASGPAPAAPGFDSPPP